MGVASALLASAADEGRNVILSMLVVGLIIVALVLLGDLNDWLARRRKYRKAARRPY